MITTDPITDGLRQRVRLLEHLLDDAVRAMDASATLSMKERTRAAIADALRTRRTLRGSHRWAS